MAPEIRPDPQGASTSASPSLFSHMSMAQLQQVMDDKMAAQQLDAVSNQTQETLEPALSFPTTATVNSHKIPTVTPVVETIISTAHMSAQGWVDHTQSAAIVAAFQKK